MRGRVILKVSSASRSRFYRGKVFNGGQQWRWQNANNVSQGGDGGDGEGEGGGGHWTQDERNRTTRDERQRQRRQKISRAIGRKYAIDSGNSFG